MSAANVPYLTIYNDLVDDLDHDGGSDDLALRLINRAQEQIIQEELWHSLLVKYQITLDSNKQADPPSDIYLNRIYAIMRDDDENNIAEVYYNYKYDINYGYEFITTGDKDTGYTSKIQFNDPPDNILYIYYQRKLDEFTGSGTEYSWFPRNLMVAAARMIYLAPEALTNNDFNAAERRYRNLLKNYSKSVQNQNTSSKFESLDDYGSKIRISRFNLSGGKTRNNYDLPIRHRYR